MDCSNHQDQEQGQDLDQDRRDHDTSSQVVGTGEDVEVVKEPEEVEADSRRIGLFPWVERMHRWMSIDAVTMSTTTD